MRVAFVTIGQSPRTDVVPAILEACRTPITPIERGVLDGMDDSAIAALAPEPGEAMLASRLADGRGVALAQPPIERRLQSILAELDQGEFDLLVPLCTGHFGRAGLRTRLLVPQQAVDQFALGLLPAGCPLGVLLPEAAQAAVACGPGGVSVIADHASPYDNDPAPALCAAGRRLAQAGLILMHCVGYDEAMRRHVAGASGRTTLLSRTLIAHAIDILLS